MKKTYAKIAVLLAAIVAVSAVITAFTGTVRRSGDRLRVVTSFYPVYIAVLNLTDGIDGVETVNMVAAQTGCLHDYQMSPDNRLVLDTADILCLNGAGAEAFLDDALAQLPALPVVNLSEGLDLLPEGDAHQHDHTHGEEHEEGNEHLWTSPLTYRRQIENLRDGLCRYDAAHAEQYRRNADAYLAKIDKVWSEMQQASAALPYRNAMLFSESLAYLARDLDLTVVAQMAVGEESGVSAGELAQAEQSLRAVDAVIMLYDGQYSAVQYTYLADVPTRSASVTLDMAVKGAADKDAWMAAMESNIAALKGVGA